MPASINGILLINKPRDMTSFGVISRVRKLSGQRRVGHTGTLDPFADGLLPVCIGRATHIVRYMDGYDKTYRVRAVFGRATDTQDLTGNTIFSHPLSEEECRRLRESDFAVLRQAVRGMAGKREQVPPMYSAVKVAGRPLYAYARKGETIERKSRQIEVYEADLEAVGLETADQTETLTATLLIRCTKGTYIRSLVDDLGRQLGFGAYADRLTRLACGPFRLEDAQDLEELFSRFRACSDIGVFWEEMAAEGRLLAPGTALTDFPTVMIAETEALRLITGQPLYLPMDAAAFSELASDRPAVFVCRDRIVAVGSLVKEQADAIRVHTERVLIDLADFRQA